MGLLRHWSRGQIAAIDIGSSAVKVLLAEGQYASGLFVRDFRVIPVAAPGRVSSASEIGAAVTSVLREMPLKGVSVRLAISGRHAIIRIVEMPKTLIDEVKRAMAFQLARYVPIPPEEVSYECTIITNAPAREGYQKVLLVAIRRAVVEQHVGILRAAGAEPLLVDVEPLAAYNALAAYSTDFNRSLGIAPAVHENVTLLHFGASHVDMCILREGVLVACRMIEIGDGELVRDVVSTLRVEPSEAVRLVREGIDSAVGMSGCYERYGTRVAGELRSSFEYLRREMNYACERIYVSGGFADRPGVAELLGRLTGLPVMRFDPLVKLNLAGLEPRVGELREQAAMFAPAVGLVVRKLAVE